MYFSSVPHKFVKASLLEDPPFLGILSFYPPSFSLLSLGIGLINLSYSNYKAFELSKKVIPFPTISCRFSFKYKGIFRDCGVEMNG